MRFLWIVLLALTLLLALAFQNVNGDVNKKKHGGHQDVNRHESRLPDAKKNHPHAHGDQHSSSNKHKDKSTDRDRKHKDKKHHKHKQASRHGSKTQRRSFQ